MEIRQFLLVGFGGFFGAICRYLVGTVVHYFSLSFFLATFTVNITGSFLIGLLATLLVQNKSLELLLITGFLGSLTTFSTFMLDTSYLLEHKKFILTISYLVIHLVVGLTFVKLGLMIGKWK